MNILPNADKAVIPIEKLTKYSLDFDKDPNKAVAFKIALGYTKNNAAMLVDDIYKSLRNFEAVQKENNGYGDIYEVVMKITGTSGKAANILTSWIVETGTNFPRLTNVYVTKKKVRGE